MTYKGSKSQAGRGKANTLSHTQMFDHFKDQMATISLDVADLSLDLQALSNGLAHWEAYYAALQDSQAKPSKKRPRSASKRTSGRQPVSS